MKTTTKWMILGATIASTGGILDKPIVFLIGMAIATTSLGLLVARDG